MQIKRNDLPARACSVNDAQSDRHETVITGRRLPYQERIRLKKLAQRTKARNLRQIKSLRIATLKVGSKKYRVDKDDGRGINSMSVQDTKWKVLRLRR